MKKPTGIEMRIVGGIDTHKDSHTAAALDTNGKILGSSTFPASACGYRALLDWLRAFGQIDRVGIEGTGSYGAGIAAHLRANSVVLVEVIRPNRQLRRRNGKSDPADAEAAARAALSGEAMGVPKSQDGVVEAIRILRLQRRSAIHARTQAANQLHAVVSTAPEALRAKLRNLSISALVLRASSFRVSRAVDVATATLSVLHGLARRWQQLHREVRQIDRKLEALIEATAPDLVALRGVGADVAGALLVAVGDNPERLNHESSFASLCGVSPIDASSGRQHRHRLNRGGNRDANRALWVIAFVRLRSDPRTKIYAEKRTRDGLSKMEILRCLKRYIAREVFKHLRVFALTTSPMPCLQPGA